MSLIWAAISVLVLVVILICARAFVQAVVVAQTVKIKTSAQIRGPQKPWRALPACSTNRDCAPGELCIQHDDGIAGHCMKSCGSDSDCSNGACGRFTAKEGSVLICCPSGQTTTYAGFDYCTQAPEGSACWSDAACDGAGMCSKENPSPCTDVPDTDAIISGCMADCEDDECNEVCADSALASFAAWAAECAITKAASRGSCTSSCDPNDPARPPGAVCVYGAWCRPERVHKTPTSETLCCPEDTYYDARISPEGCVPYAACLPERVHFFRGVAHCCPSDSYYDAADDVCLPYSRCRDASGKPVRCATGKKCDPANRACV